MRPPADGWTFDDVKDLDVPFDWELVDGQIAVRGATKWWHDQVRDRLYFRLESQRQPPYAVKTQRWTMLDERTVPRPDVVVFDKTDLDIRTVECIPVAAVALAVEVVSHGSRSDDRFRKPGLYAEDDLPVVHAFRRHEETGVYAPAPDRPTHTGKLVTRLPFPVEIDLRSLVEV